MHSREGLQYCKQCELVAKMTKRELDCDSCENKQPELPIELMDIFNCLSVCSSQLRVGFGGAYALDYVVVIRAASDFGIKTNRAFYRILQGYESVLIKELSKQSEEDSKTNKNKG